MLRIQQITIGRRHVVVTATKAMITTSSSNSGSSCSSFSTCGGGGGGRSLLLQQLKKKQRLFSKQHHHNSNSNNNRHYHFPISSGGDNTGKHLSQTSIQRYFSSKDDDDDSSNDRSSNSSSRGGKQLPRRGVNVGDANLTPAAIAAINEPLDKKKTKRITDVMVVDDDNDDERLITPEDPFGLMFHDTSDQLGSILPPIYERDNITGRLISDNENYTTTPSSSSSSMTTSSNMMKQQQQLSDDDKHILNMDSIERDINLLDTIQKHWLQQSQIQKNDTASTTTTTTNDNHNDELTAMGERIRTTDMATNVLGRSVHSQKTKELLDNGTEIIARDTKYNFSQPLTLEEYNTLQQYMNTKYDTNISVDDIPVSTQPQPNPLPIPPSPKSAKTTYRPKMEETSLSQHPDEAELSLKWLTSRAQRQMDDSLEDNPYSDLMPHDLSPKRVVNRKSAKIIPTQLLHYNHMSLLQHFIGPTGQIMNRSQTRLGARDQRRISKLIKRSRALGIIPYVGQFKIENHGWVHTNDIHVSRHWEKQIEQRGLVIQQQQKSISSSGTSNNHRPLLSNDSTPHKTGSSIESPLSSASNNATTSMSSSGSGHGALPDDPL